MEGERRKVTAAEERDVSQKSSLLLLLAVHTTNLL